MFETTTGIDPQADEGDIDPASSNDGQGRGMLVAPRSGFAGRFVQAITAAHWRRALIITTSALTALSVWQFAADVIVSDKTLLPSPSAVLVHSWELLRLPDAEGGIAGDILASVRRVAVGWAAGVVLGVALGAAFATSEWLRVGVDPIMQAFRAVPPIAYAPLMVVWLGLGEASKYTLLTLGVLPIIAINTSAAVTGIDQTVMRVTSSLGASRLYALRRIVLPGVLPDILTSMRVTLGLAWATVVAAELVAADQGLGYRILIASQFLNTETMFTGMLAIGLLAMISDRVLIILQGWLVPWRGRA